MFSRILENHSTFRFLVLLLVLYRPATPKQLLMVIPHLRVRPTSCFLAAWVIHQIFFRYPKFPHRNIRSGKISRSGIHEKALISVDFLSDRQSVAIYKFCEIFASSCTRTCLPYPAGQEQEPAASLNAWWDGASV